MEEKKVITLEELAAYLKCSEPTVKKLMNNGLPYFRIGSNYRFFFDEITQYFNSKPKQEIDERS